MEKEKLGKTYEAARLDIYKLASNDVICTSGEAGTSSELGSSGSDPSAWL